MVGKGISERRNERADLAACRDGIDDAAVVRTQHAPLVGHPDFRNVFAFFAHTAHVIGAAVHRREQLADLLGRILQVCVERDDPFAANALEAGDDRQMLPVVGVEEYDPRHVRPCLELILQQRRGAIAAAVVHEDHLVRHGERVERRIKSREQRRQTRLLVVDGYYHRKVRCPHRLCRAMKSVHAAQTRSTSASVIAACSGSVTVESEIRSVFGRSPR